MSNINQILQTWANDLAVCKQIREDWRFYREWQHDWLPQKEEDFDSLYNQYLIVQQSLDLGQDTDQRRDDLHTLVITDEVRHVLEGSGSSRSHAMAHSLTREEAEQLKSIKRKPCTDYTWVDWRFLQYIEAKAFAAYEVWLS
ncbi:hypothetical protein HW132_27935 [Brasilonema sp. CT11]|nr:hypothetical protein [Brasilonema sp. CT11]